MQSSDIYSDSGPLRPPLSLPLLFFVPCFSTGDSMMFVTGEVWVLFQAYSDHAAVALAAVMPVRGCRGCPGNLYSAQQSSDLNARNFLTCRKVRRIAGLEEVSAVERSRTFTTGAAEHIFRSRFIFHVPGAADRMFPLATDKLPVCSRGMRH